MLPRANKSTRIQIQKLRAKLTNNLDPSEFVFTDANGQLSTINSPLDVPHGGLGVATLTDHSILLGSGTGAVTALGAATNGQLPIGSTGADPTLATITSGTGVTVTNGAGSITLSTNDSEIDHDSLSNFSANEHFLQTAITNVSTALSTGILKVTTGTGALSAISGISNTSLVLDDGTTEKITLVFTDGILTSRTVEATTGSLLIDWTD